MSDADELFQLASGEIKRLSALDDVEATALYEWLVAKAERMEGQADRVARGEAPLCDYWSPAQQQFCDRPAVAVFVGERLGDLTERPVALCDEHRILATPK